MHVTSYVPDVIMVAEIRCAIPDPFHTARDHKQNTNPTALQMHKLTRLRK